MKKHLTIALALASFSLPLFAAPSEEAKQEIIGIVNSYNAFSANFKQVAKTPKGATISQSSGAMKALKPNYLYLHTQSPNELYLSVNGRQVENYDPFVEQVTRSTLKPNENIPFGYLLTAGQEAWKNVKVEKSANCYTISDANDKQFKKVKVCVSNQQVLSSITLFETNGNTNTYTLTGFKAGGVSSGDFKINYPANTKVQTIQ